ncbi:T-complex protein 1 subunit beta-like isoform X2 [Lycorma delicatula]|uniref:T-complex protein 1 subunit beta-like isoform X2 n=1 Tax=Lycorma delicatula TaxID=130591 RepID=UPI003F50EF9D
MVSLNPVRTLKNEAAEEKAETARMSSFIGAIAVGDLVKSTLGPKGMDKILVSSGRNEGQVEVTNDGATILKNIGVDNPAAKVLVDISRVQDDEVGDGTTSVTVLAPRSALKAPSTPSITNNTTVSRTPESDDESVITGRKLFTLAKKQD